MRVEEARYFLLKTIAREFDVILLVRSFQFFIHLDAFSRSLQFSELEEVFATSVRAGGTTAYARTGGR